MHPRKQSLRPKTPLPPAMKLIETKRKQIVTSRQRQEDKMHALALKLGYFCVPTSSFMIDLSTRVTAAIRQRAAQEVYQTAAFSLQSFPVELARRTFALASLDPSTPDSTTTWTVKTMAQTAQVFGCIFEDGGPWCTGASKAFKSASEPVVRVIATIMPGAVISHVVHKRGVERL